MSLLIIFAFASGVATALTPCVLPILPIILASSNSTGKRRPLGIVVGLILSFTFFTLFLTTLIKLFNFPPDLLRNIAIIVLFLFGLTMIVPAFTRQFEKITSGLISRVGRKTTKREGFIGGLILGSTLGLLWTPCAGPILASVITLAATSSVTAEAVVITFAYACGTATVLLLVLYTGKWITNKLLHTGIQTSAISRIFGVIMILMSVTLVTNLDRRFQTYIIQNLPSWALTPLGSIESSERVSNLLNGISPQTQDTNSPQFDSSRLLFNYGKAPEITGIAQWINTDNKTYSINELKGNVVLVDFWTYSCVNCIRTLPYLRTWDEKYKAKGLTILGIHSPEFAFERVPENVRKAIADFNIKYPVGLDNEFGTWKAFNNRYWPAKYLIDAQGNIRYRHFGEGRYDQTERAIQLLLADAGQKADLQIDTTDTTNYSQNRTPETYMGLSRQDSNRMRLSQSINPYTNQTFNLIPNINRDQLTLDGAWSFSEEFAEAGKGAKLNLYFRSREANLVMSTASSDTSDTPNTDNAPIPAIQDNNIPKGTNFCTNELCIGGGVQDTSGIPVKVRVLNPKRINTSTDLREGTVYVSTSKLYPLVELSSETESIIELEFPEGGVRLFAWTF